MRLAPATLGSIIIPLRIAGMAAPPRALHGNRHVEKRTHVRNGTVQFLKVHIQRLALGTARLLVQPDSLHIETFENGLVEKVLRVRCICGYTCEALRDLGSPTGDAYGALVAAFRNHRSRLGIRT